jgi:hypothetical protein
MCCLIENNIFAFFICGYSTFVLIIQFAVIVTISVNWKINQENNE